VQPVRRYDKKKNKGMRNPSWRQEISVKKTEIEAQDRRVGHDPPPRNPKNWCIVHYKGHPLSKCRAFQAKPLDERTTIQRKNRVCFRCIASCEHLAKDCKAKVVCTECGSNKHLVALHIDGEQRHAAEQAANKDQSDDGTNPRHSSRRERLQPNAPK
jgi:hypothetical protein